MAWVTWKQCILLCTVNKHNNIFKDPLYVCWPWLPQTHILVHTTCMYVICRGPDVGKAWVNRPGLCWLCIQPDSVHTMKGGGGLPGYLQLFVTRVGWFRKRKMFSAIHRQRLLIFGLYYAKYFGRINVWLKALIFISWTCTGLWTMTTFFIFILQGKRMGGRIKFFYILNLDLHFS